MSDLLLDLDPDSANYGDFLLTNNDLTIVTDQKLGIEQFILQRLRTYLGEWFMDLSIGVDYFGQILLKNPDIADIDAIIQTTILQTPGVNELVAYSFNPNFQTRVLSLAFTVNTISGVVNYQGALTA